MKRKRPMRASRLAVDDTVPLSSLRREGNRREHGMTKLNGEEK